MDYYNDEYPGKRSILSYVLVSLISAVIGGMLSLSLAPLVYGEGLNSILGQQTVIEEKNKEEKSLLPGGSLDYSPVVAISEKVGPTVVGITSQVKGSNPFSLQYVEQGSGSGVIISKEGYIVTNNHVIEGADKIIVNLADGNKVEASIQGKDPETDLAVLKIDVPNLPVSTLGDSEQLRVGELVVAIGNPLGDKFARSVTAGVLSAKERNITIQDRTFKLLQTDAAINPGNSGGALVNSKGEVIGINSAKLVIQGVEGMGFAIPITDAKPIIHELIEKGYVGRPALGIWGWVIDEQLAKENNIPQGLYITEVINEGPAYKAGIKAEDIIIGINGSTISSFYDLQEKFKPYKPGDKVTVNIYRHGKKLDVPLVLGERGNK